MLIRVRACCEVTAVSREVQFFVVSFHGVRVDRHVLAGIRFEPDDLRVTRAAADDTPLVHFGGVLFEAHAFTLSSRSVSARISAAARTRSRRGSFGFHHLW